MIKRVFIFVAFLSLFSKVSAQKDTYDQIKTQYDSLRKAENYEEAKKLLLRNLDFQKFDIIQKINLFGQIGECYYNLNNIDSSQLYFISPEKLIKQQSLSNVDSLKYTIKQYIAYLYYDNSEFDNALEKINEVLVLQKESIGTEHPDYATSINFLALIYTELEDLIKSEKYYNEALRIFNNSGSKYVEDLCAVLNNLGHLLFDQGKFIEAKSKYLESINMRIQNSKYNFPEKLVKSYSYVSDVFMELEQYDSCLVYLNKALCIMNLQQLENDDLFIDLLDDISFCHATKNDYKSSKTVLIQLLSIIEKKFGCYSLEYTYHLENLAGNYNFLYQHDSSLNCYNRCLNIYDKLSIRNDERVYEILSSIAVIYSNQGNYLESQKVFEKLFELINTTLIVKDEFYIRNLLSLGLIYFELGKYSDAEKIYLKAISRINSSNYFNDKILADVNRRMGLLHLEIGNYVKSEYYLELALEKSKKFIGSEGELDLALDFTCNGWLNYLRNDLNKAEKYYLDAEDLYLKNLGEKHEDYALICNNLAVLYSSKNDLVRATHYFKKVIEIEQSTLGQNHPSFAKSLNNVSDLFIELNRIDSAEFYCNRATKIIKENLGEQHSDYISCIDNMSEIYLTKGDLNGTSILISESLKLRVNSLKMNFEWLSENEKKQFWGKNSIFFQNLNSFCVLCQNSMPLANITSYSSNLISKSLLLETSRELDQAVSQSSDVEMKAQFSEMKQLRKLYSKMQSEGSANKEIMERCKTQADSLDKILVNKLGEYTASKRKFEITWKDVQSNLTTSDAAIEFARYYDDKDSLYKYMALVVRPDYEYPKLVSLGGEEDIRTATQNKDFSALYNEAWKGIDSLLVGVKRVYYSPAGELNNVSFLALCMEEDNELVATNKDKNRGLVIGSNKTTTKACNAVLMDKYELNQLTTTRYLADGTLKKEKPMQPSLALVGGINFDDVPDNTKEADKEQSNEDFAFHANLNKRSASTNGKKRGKRSSSNYGKKMDPLPGTKEEVVNIAGLLNTSNWKVQTKSDKKAGEYEFKKELETKAPGVLHIATHGFAFPDEAKKETKLMDMNQKSTYKVSEDPMVRCGLMLGGSNISWTGNPQKMIEQTGDDGILTAAEVANLDLSNTKLVVLSACETGLGKIEGSEGTFGLKRGFKLAGVEQMIVSLWSVPDKETMELMTLFYSDLTKTLNPVTSFEKAQKEMRAKYPTDPEKWAGFVLVR
jgi:Tfp pilus assembly protein PilF